jgi:hypothetical protein
MSSKVAERGMDFQCGGKIYHGGTETLRHTEFLIFDL